MVSVSKVNTPKVSHNFFGQLVQYVIVNDPKEFEDRLDI